MHFEAIYKIRGLSLSSPIQRHEALFQALARGEGTNSARLLTPGRRKAQQSLKSRGHGCHGHKLDILPDVSVSKIYVRDFQELASAFVRFLASVDYTCQRYCVSNSRSHVSSTRQRELRVQFLLSGCVI